MYPDLFKCIFCINFKDLTNLTDISDLIIVFCLIKIILYSPRYNSLTEIPASLTNCTKLADLNVEGNQLKGLPEGLLSSLSSVKTVCLSRNSFTSYPVGGCCFFCV